MVYWHRVIRAISSFDLILLLFFDRFLPSHMPNDHRSDDQTMTTTSWAHWFRLRKQCCIEKYIREKKRTYAIKFFWDLLVGLSSSSSSSSSFSWMFFLSLFRFIFKLIKIVKCLLVNHNMRFMAIDKRHLDKQCEQMICTLHTDLSVSRYAHQKYIYVYMLNWLNKCHLRFT